MKFLDDTVRKGSNLYKMDHLYEIMKKDFQIMEPIIILQTTQINL
jgi:hypothetical protein